MQKIKYTILFLLFFMSSIAQRHEKGVPRITNYPPKIYGYEGKNYSVLTDDRNIVFAGNLNGVLIFDGINWDFVYMPGGPMLAKADNGNIYAAGYNKIGIFKKGKQNDTYFYQISNNFPEKYKNLRNITDIFTIKDNFIFVSNNKLFYYTNDLYLIDTNPKGYKLYKINNEIYVNKIGKGLFKYTENDLKSYCNEILLKENKIEIILPFNDKLLVKLKHKSFYIVDKNNINEFATNSKHFFKNLEITSGSALDKNKYVLGSKKCGIIVIDKNGTMLCNINTNSGLYDDWINNVFVDKKSKQVWVAMNNGLARIEMPSAFTFFDKSSGLRNGTYDIIKHNNTIYVATGHGVYYQYKNCIYNINYGCYTNKRYFPIANINVKTNDLITINNNLFAITDNGVYKIIEHYAKLLFKGYYKKIKQSLRDSTLYFISSTQGLFFTKYKNNTLYPIGQLKNLKSEVKTIAESKNGFLWLGSDYKGVFKVNFTEKYDINAIVININRGLGLPDKFQWIDVYETSNGVLFSTNKGIYRYNFYKSKFFPDTLLELDFKTNKRWVYPLKEDKNKNIWFSSGYQNKFKKITGVCLYKGKNKKYEVVTQPFNIINDFTIETIFCNNDSIIYLGTYDNLIRININTIHSEYTPPLLFFKQISLNNDSIIYNYLNTNTLHLFKDSLKIKYSYNSIKFSFFSPSYISKDNLYYSYKLENYDKEWSEWNKHNTKEYTNLYEGNYTFKVKAKDIYNNISQEITYYFRIKPPKYRTWYAYILYLIFLISFVIMLIKYRSYLYAKEKQLLEKEIAEKTEEIVRQKEKAEMLIKNMLPEDMAKELQSKGRAKRKKYDNATVLFSDIQGFTNIAEHMHPDTLLDELDRLFFKFDTIVGNHKIEKIKTIGDAYMCAGGIPKTNRTHAIDVVLAAIEMIDFMKELRRDAQNQWRIRIGIHTGPIIAGIVGSRKLSYDIWGDTVNIASRMESSGIPGHINISVSTYERIKKLFECEHRGKIPIKYKGAIDMFFVIGIKSEFSKNREGRIPNKKFWYHYKKINFHDLEDLVYYKLEKGLNPDIIYHNVKHTIDVVNEVEKIAKSEKVDEEDILILKVAALLHDIGFIIGYSDHEESSVKLAKDILPYFGYTEEEINKISELIYATKFPPRPKNKLEEIICDADLDYLGRPDFIPVSKLLFEEMFKFKKIKSEKEWNLIQINFLENHQYFTETARRNREVNKNIQLEKLKELMKEQEKNKDNKK